MSQQTVYDLDAQFGGSAPIKVKFNQHVYALRRMQDLEPAVMLRVGPLLAQYSAILTMPKGSKRKHVNEKEFVARLERVVDEILGLICPEIVDAGLPFMKKIATLRYYNEMTRSTSGDLTANPKGAQRGTHDRSSTRSK